MLQKLGIHRWLMLLALATTFLTGCNGNDNNTAAATSFAGVAAVGAPFTGSLDIVDANGVTRTGIAIGADGSYTADTTGMAAPFILRATGTGANAGTVLYSVADALTGNFNITPMTNLALEVARLSTTPPQADLATLFANWNAVFDPADLTTFQTDIRDALAIVNANLNAQLAANGLNPATYDFLRDTFPAFGQGIDAVLDGLVIAMDNGITITFHNTPLAFNIDIDISGYVIGGGGGGGNTNCAAGATNMTFAKAGQAAGPYNDGEQVCFTASTTSLAFSGKTLTNPTQNQAVLLPFSAYLFTDAVTGNKYEVVFNNSAMHEINVLSSADTFLGQFTATPGNGGGTGGVTMSFSTSVAGETVFPDILINGIPAPTSEAEFCGGIPTDTNLIQAFASMGSIVVDSCSFVGNVGTVNVTISSDNPVMTLPYTVTFTFN